MHDQSSIHPRYFLCYHLAVFTCKGPDAAKFLQGQVTCDVSKITTANGALGAYANLQGRTIATFYLLNDGTQFYGIVAADLLPVMLSTLQKYAVFSKVTLQAEPDVVVLGYQGSGREIHVDSQQAPYSSATCDDLRLLIIPGLPMRALLIGSQTATQTHLQQHSNSLQNATEWQLIDIDNGLPLLSSATSATQVPQRLNLDTLGALSFTKGCYFGQEVIARLHYRGQSKQHLYRVELHDSEELAPGAALIDRDGNEFGMVINFVRLSAQLARALVVLPDEKAIDQDLQHGQLRVANLN